VSPKSWLLVGLAVAVFAAGVYLFVQVKSTPAEAQTTAPTKVAGRPSPAVERAPTPPTPTPAPVPSTPTPMPTDPGLAKLARASKDAVATAPPTLASEEEGQRANPRMDSMMELANKAYDRQDFDEAIAIAGKVLSKDPSNTRMLRVMISANCIGGDAAVAQAHYDKLPPKSVDREQMRTRCDRYQVTLKD